MWSTPAPVSVAARCTSTGALVYQPAHAAPLQSTELVGADESGVTVNDAGLEVRFALLVAVTLFGSAGSEAPEAKLYEPPLDVQPLPRLGKAYEATPDSGSVETAPTVKPPAVFGL